MRRTVQLKVAAWLAVLALLPVGPLATAAQNRPDVQLDESPFFLSWLLSEGKDDALRLTLPLFFFMWECKTDPRSLTSPHLCCAVTD